VKYIVVQYVYLLVLRDCTEMVDYMSNRKVKFSVYMTQYPAVVISWQSSTY